MWIKRQSARNAVVRLLLTMRKELPEERVLPIRGGTKPGGWLLQVLPVAGLVVWGFALRASADWQSCVGLGLRGRKGTK